MYRGLYLLALLCLHFAASTQTTHYFIDNARWVYQTMESYEPNQIFSYSGLEENTILGDTAIAGIQYKKLYKRYIHYHTASPPHPHPSTSTTSYEHKGPMFIRYDSLENKVFYKENADSSEVIIYNFNLSVGDTIVLGTSYFNGNKVLRIDTISLFGNLHELFVLDSSFIPIRIGIIEGIGGMNGLTYNQPPLGALGGGIFMTDLVCFEYGDMSYFLPWTLHNQFPCPSVEDFLSSTKEDFSKAEISVSPNPNNGFFTLNIPEIVIGSSLKIFNETGAIVYSSKISQTTAEVEILYSGLYFWYVFTNTGKYSSGKIVVNRF